MRLLVTGAAGMLGRAVADAARERGHDVAALARASLDVTDPGSLAAALALTRPDAVVNCAAWTDVDGAETAERQATAVNGAGAGAVSAAAARAGAVVLHVSSDYVVDGRAREPYREDAPRAPLGAYGRSKLAGEHAVAAAAPDTHAIVRTAWLFGRHGRNFVDTILRAGAERGELDVVDDQVGSPTFAGHLAPALLAIAQARTRGVLHVAGTGTASRYELAEEALRQAGVTCALRRARTVDLPAAAPRPAYSVLASTRADAPRLPGWREGVAAHVARAVAAR